MNWIFVTVIVGLIVFLWLYNVLTPSSELRKYGNRLPGPKPLPIIGNLLTMYSKKTFLESVTDAVRTYGPVTRIWLGKELNCFLTDPKDIQMILSHNEHLNRAPSWCRMFEPWLGTKGLFTATGAIWYKHRKLLTPCFHFKILEQATGMIEKHAEILCQQLEAEVNQPDCDIDDYVGKCALDIICETAMGIDLQSQVSQNREYLDAIKLLIKLTVIRLYSLWLHPECIFQLTRIGRSYYKSLNYITEFAHKMITSRKEILINNHSLNKENEREKNVKHKPFLDFVLQESNFTDEEVLDEVHTFMLADKIIEEITTLSKCETELTYQDYHSMKYLENVIKETLRMYTSPPLIARNIEKNITLPSGHTLPVGTIANFFLFYLHNDLKYYKHAHQFTPERFENQENQPYTYIPFGAGSRICIGQKFAYIVMKIILFAIVKKYRLLPVQSKQSLTLEMNIALVTPEGISIKIERRN